MKPIPFVDIGGPSGLPEDERIRLIGEKAMLGGVVAFITDADPGKADRYVSKLLKLFPQLRVVDRFDGPTPGAVTVKVSLGQG